MGHRTDAKIQDWQQRAGITEARGARAQTLERMSQLAFALIKAIERDRSGIRDGDGFWHGSDVLSGLVHQLVKANRDNSEAWTAGSEPIPPPTWPTP